MEWSVSIKTLQKQLGEEQHRGAQMELERTRLERSFRQRESDQELALAREQAARKHEEDGHKVALFFGELAGFLYL
jgi:hypothetical protein